MDQAWTRVREKFGVKSVIGAIIAIYALVPDQISYFSFWKDVAASLVRSHWFLAWFLPELPRLCVVILGMALVLWDYRQKSNQSAYNLKVTKITSTQVLYSPHGQYMRKVDIPLSQHAYLMEIINEAKPKRNTRGTGKVLAQLRFKSGESVQLASPGVWVGEYFSSVEFGPGETRELILTLRNQLGLWAIGFNRRGNAGEAVSTHFDEIIPKFAAGTLRVDLISCEAGRVIASAEAEWQWPHDPNDIPRFTGYRQITS